MQIVVYTANIGNYDLLQTPQFAERNKNVKFVLFTTDLNFRSNFWDVRFIDNANLINKDNQRVARYFKLQPHKVLPPHDVSIWFDSCLTLKIPDYLQFIDENLLSRGLDTVVYSHPKRNCLYREASVCISQNLDDKGIIEKQVLSYKQQRFPANYGLYDTGLMIRTNSKKMQEFNDLWYHELKNGSKRDQISHPFCIFKKNIKIKTFTKGANKGHSPFLVKRKHIKARISVVKNKSSQKDIAVEVMNRKIAYKMRLR